MRQFEANSLNEKKKIIDANPRFVYVTFKMFQEFWQVNRTEMFPLKLLILQIYKLLMVCAILI